MSGNAARRRRTAQVITLLAALALPLGCGSVAGTAQPISSAIAAGTGSSTSAGAPTSGPQTTGPQTTGPPTTGPQTTGPSGTGPPTTGVGDTDRPTTADPAGEGSDQAPGGLGAAGVGDPYYPQSGNGGYQVAGYDVALRYDPETNALAATATISATVRSSNALRRFDFDLQSSMQVTSVTIDGATATFAAKDAELVVTPAKPLPAGSTFTAVVTYGGEPTAVSGGTSGLGDGGWYRTRSGGALVAGEPLSASAWFPVNEHPSDPATFAVTVTVPTKWKVISGGLEQTTGLPAAPAGMRVSRWVQDLPVASYLVTLYIDTFTVKTGALPDGTPVVSAFAPGDAGDESLHDQTPAVVELLSKYFGKFPFKAVGGIYSDENIPFALETATRPVYADWVDLDTVVHELAHQWYGDLVMVHRWSAVCLNECFASYAPWLWHAGKDGTDLDAQWKRIMTGSAQSAGFWSSPLVDMGAGREFTAVYERGPLALHALRREIGDPKFFELLKKWPDTYAGRTATFGDLEKMASELAGKDLTSFFQIWFRGTAAPKKSDYPAALR